MSYTHLQNMYISIFYCLPANYVYCMYVCLSIFLSTCIPAFLYSMWVFCPLFCVCLLSCLLLCLRPAYLSLWLPVYLSAHLSTFFVYLSVPWFVDDLWLSPCRGTPWLLLHLLPPVCLSVYLPAHLSTFLFTFLPICLPVFEMLLAQSLQRNTVVAPPPPASATRPRTPQRSGNTNISSLN